MLSQTVDNLMPLLSLLQQPAFCIRNDGILTSNQAAAQLVPLQPVDVPHWLGDGAQLWNSWDRTTALELPITLQDRPYRVTIQALQDGTLFLLTAETVSESTDAALSVVAQVLRQPLTDLSAIVQRLFDSPDFIHHDEYTSIMTRQIYRMTRLTSNLADLAELRSGNYRLHLELLDINLCLESLPKELAFLCEKAGRTFQYTPLHNSLLLQADPALLERAILNLISNALKFSRENTPIHLWTEISGNYLLIRVRSQCDVESSELLHTIFSRLEQRDALPDPRWGIGLGLPICQAIAQLHGGMVAVETTPTDCVTVTLSLKRRHTAGTSVLKAPSPFEYTGGMRPSLVELSDVLPNSCYHKDSL